MTRETLACCQVVELVTDYLEGTVTVFDRARVESHLARCQACLTYVRQIRQTVCWLGTLPDEPIAPPARAELQRLFRGWQQGSA